MRRAPMKKALELAPRPFVFLAISAAYPWRATIIFLISAMALAGLRPLGQVLVQFMMVWQR